MSPDNVKWYFRTLGSIIHERRIILKSIFSFNSSLLWDKNQSGIRSIFNVVKTPTQRNLIWGWQEKDFAFNTNTTTTATHSMSAISWVLLANLYSKVYDTLPNMWQVLWWHLSRQLCSVSCPSWLKLKLLVQLVGVGFDFVFPCHNNNKNKNLYIISTGWKDPMCLEGVWKVSGRCLEGV